jgi:hypothetical protein
MQPYGVCRKSPVTVGIKGSSSNRGVKYGYARVSTDGQSVDAPGAATCQGRMQEGVPQFGVTHPRVLGVEPTAHSGNARLRTSNGRGFFVVASTAGAHMNAESSATEALA